VRSSQGGVLEGPPPGDFHELYVDLDGFPRLGLLKEPHLARHPLARPSQARQADIPNDPLDRAHGHPNVVNTPEPKLRALGAVLELATSLANQFDDPRRYPTLPVPRTLEGPPDASGHASGESSGSSRQSGARLLSGHEAV
jgi:hypothetical protein